jgi:hypothetical protein
MSLHQVNKDIHYLKESNCSFGAKRKQPPIQQTDDEVCSICFISLGENPPITTTVCNHQFHTECLCQWLRRTNVKERTNCPVCRRIFTSDQVDSICGPEVKRPPIASRKIDVELLEDPIRRAQLGMRPATRITDDGDW